MAAHLVNPIVKTSFEKIGGTVHMAVGQGYPETGSSNTSAVHWDMICDMRDGGEILVDGELFYEDGKFLI